MEGKHTVGNSFGAVMVVDLVGDWKLAAPWESIEELVENEADMVHSEDRRRKAMAG